ncbi:MAG: Fe-S cluster assembly protein SufD [Candidatus Kapaibacteriales bacterium]
MKSNFQNTLLTEFEIMENLHSHPEKKAELEVRRKAIEHFKQKGFPTLKTELWKYTPVNFVNKHEFKLLNDSHVGQLAEGEVEKLLIPNLDCHRIVMLNGFLDSEHTSISGEDGLKLKSLRSDGAADFENDSPDYSEHAFAALNTALYHDGFVLEVSDGKEISKPVHIINIIDTDAEPVIAQCRNFIRVGRNAKLDIIESNKTFGYNESLQSDVLKIKVGENSEVKHYKFQDDNDRSYSINLVEAEVERDSRYSEMNITLGGRFVRNDIRVKIQGENAYPSLEGVFVADKDMLVDNHTFLDHAVPNCPSNEVYRAVLQDKAKGVFNGKILVRQDAQKTNAYQSSKAVLLSDTATMNSKPELEIYADDVKCSHGASTGSIDEDALFYLRARGISEAQAKAMLLNAFVHEITDRIHIEELREEVNRRVNKKFGL